MQVTVDKGWDLLPLLPTPPHLAVYPGDFSMSVFKALFGTVAHHPFKGKKHGVIISFLMDIWIISYFPHH